MQRFQLGCDWGQTSHLAMVFTATWSEKTFDCILVYLRDAFFEEKIKLPDWIWIKFLSKCFKRFIYLFFFRVNFKNLTIEFYIPYVLNIKFCLNRMLFTCTNQNVDFNECNPGQRISFSDGPRRFNGQISSATFLLSLEKKSKSRSCTSRNVDEDVKFIFGRLKWGRLGIMLSICDYIV